MAEHFDIRSDGRTWAALVEPGPHESDGLLMSTLAEHVARALDCSECCIYDYLPETAALRARVIWSKQLTPRDREWVGETHELAELPDFARVVDGGEVIVSYPDDSADAATAGFESMTYWGELAAIWAPIVHRGEVLGILELTEKEHPVEYGDDELQLVPRMAALAAVALHHARATRVAEDRNRQLTALIDSSKVMTSTLDLDEVLDAVCRQTALALDAGASYIYEYDPVADALVWLAQYQRDPEHMGDAFGERFPLADYPQHRAVIGSRRPVEARVDDPDLDPATLRQMEGWQEQSSLMVPLVIGQEVLGALEVSEPAFPRHFDEDETALCVALGEQAAVALHNAELYRRLQEQKAVIERQAVTDDLTGLANHRCFWERLHAEVSRARRYGQPLSLIVLDLDDFKAVNDDFGHLAGDHVLAAVGKVLREQVRQGVDISARHGGEEFAVILPSTESLLDDGTTMDGAFATAERIRRAIAALRPEGIDPAWPGVTASIGIATLPRHAAGAEELVSRADEALYESKRRGKDQVTVYGASGAAARYLSPRQ